MYIIDRIENNIAIIEDKKKKKIIEVNIKYLPDNIKEGNILTFNGKEYKINTQDEIERRKKIQDKFNRLKN